MLGGMGYILVNEFASNVPVIGATFETSSISTSGCSIEGIESNGEVTLV